MVMTGNILEQGELQGIVYIYILIKGGCIYTYIIILFATGIQRLSPRSPQTMLCKFKVRKTG